MHEPQMERLVRKWLKRKKYRVESEVRISGGHRPDLVAYDKTSGVFTVVECKSTHEKSTVKRAFDQLVRYRDAISRQPDEFVDRVSRKMKMRFSRWMEATDCGRRVRVEFIAGLRDRACDKIQSVRDQKSRRSSVGIIRCKDNGQCKLYVKIESGAEDPQLCKAKVETFILRNHRPPSGSKTPTDSKYSEVSKLNAHAD
jgi:DNA-dependent RNA polymerase auxiliary subunit epsilon